MPNFSFACQDCNYRYDAFEKYDPSGEYKKVLCPKCSSASKSQRLGAPSIVGQTRSNMENYEYRANHNLEKAKQERRDAEAKAMNPAYDRLGPEPMVDPGNYDVA